MNANSATPHSASPVGRSNADQSALDHPTVRVLYVEDILGAYESLARLLRHWNWLVIHAANPDQAVQKLEASSAASYDIILIDRMLHEDANVDSWKDRWGGDPRHAGDVLLKYVAANYPYICPIVLTSLDDYAAARRATHHGALDYIVKGHKGNQPTFIENLYHRCRAALRRHHIRRLRHSLLARRSFDHLLMNLFVLLRDELETHNLNLFYLAIQPGGAALLQTARNNPDLVRPLAGMARAAEEEDSVLIEPRGNVKFVLETSLDSYVDDAEALRGRTFTPDADCQLLSPVKVSPHPDSQRLPVAGIFGVELRGQNKLSEGDRELVQELTDLAGDYLAAHGYHQHFASQEIQAEHKQILSILASRAYNPLEQCRGIFDHLDRLLKSECPNREDLEESVSEAREMFSESLDALDGARRGLMETQAEPEIVDLRDLVNRALTTSAANLKLAGVEIERSPAPEPLRVRVVAVQLLYLLERLIRDVCMEAQEMRGDLPVGRQRPNRLTVKLQCDPERKLTVRLLLQDNGPPWPDELLQRLYFTRMDRYSPEPPSDNRGLTLWETQRFAELSNGRLDLHSLRGADKMLELFLPLA